jgi:NADPH:quinone reductase-like Zn-dependent oxidoreductase
MPKIARFHGVGGPDVLRIEEEPIRKPGEGEVRVTFDPVGGPLVEKLPKTAAIGGTIFEYGLLSMQPTPFPLFSALSKGLCLRGYSLTEVTRDPQKLPAAKKYVYDRLAGGRFRPKVAKVFSFAQTAEAYKYMESNAQAGAVVITVP